MKNRISKFIAVFILACATFSVQAAINGSSFDDYHITPVEKQEIKSNVENAWVLSYAKSKFRIEITAQQEKKCKIYLVRSDHFEVAYVCSEKGFGARPIKMKDREISDEITSQVINQNELKKQRIISAIPVDSDTALQLIAGYLPDLVNTRYQHLLVD